METTEQDHPPVVPAMFVSEWMDLKPLRKAELRIVWSREGHIAGLLEGDMLLSVIPSWADGIHFPGYAAYVKADCKVAWKLTDVLAVLAP